MADNIYLDGEELKAFLRNLWYDTKKEYAHYQGACLLYDLLHRMGLEARLCKVVLAGPDPDKEPMRVMESVGQVVREFFEVGDLGNLNLFRTMLENGELGQNDFAQIQQAIKKLVCEVHGVNEINIKDGVIETNIEDQKRIENLKISYTTDAARAALQPETNIEDQKRIENLEIFYTTDAARAALQPLKEENAIYYQDHMDDSLGIMERPRSPYERMLLRKQSKQRRSKDMRAQYGARSNPYLFGV